LTGAEEINQIPFSPLSGGNSKKGKIGEIMEPADFSWALKKVKFGKSIRREGWNGEGLKVKAQFPDENSKMTLPYLYIEYPDGRRCPWLASQTDIMSEDWDVVE
jgi:hypothetical protein